MIEFIQAHKGLILGIGHIALGLFILKMFVNDVRRDFAELKEWKRKRKINL